MKKRESATEALNKLNMMPLERKREVHLGVITHKLLQGKGPKNLVSECQSLTKRQHSHNTRSTKKRDMSIISHRTSKSESSFTQRSVACWNNIPLAIRSIDSTSSFKRTFQQLLLTNYKSDVLLCGAI